MGELFDFLSDILAWLVDLLLWLPRLIWDAVLDALASVIELIPVPSWLEGADPFGSLDPGVVFFADAFLISEGITIILGAYVIRFLIRRLPLVG